MRLQQFVQICSPVVLELLQGEDMLVEVLLEFLVGVVDVKLLKSIDLEAGGHISMHKKPPMFSYCLL